MTNVPITQKPGGGKTFTTQLVTPTLVRRNRSILDRGDSLAGGKQIPGKLPEEDPEQPSLRSKEKTGCL
jgi:hypothetical protein